MSSSRALKAKKDDKGRLPERDVRQELIDAALAIIDEHGIEGLTLRGAAARVGVSHAAPAHHFRGLPDLLGCVCGVGFQQLAQHIQEYQKGKGDPHDRLVAVCEAYVDFAMNKPGLMSLMFNTDRNKVDKQGIGNFGQEAYGLLKDACTPFEPLGRAPDSTETCIWSLVHGMAFLQIGGRFDNPGRITSDPKIADVLPKLALRQ